MTARHRFDELNQAPKRLKCEEPNFFGPDGLGTVGVRPVAWNAHRRAIRQPDCNALVAVHQHVENLAAQRMVPASNAHAFRCISKDVLSMGQSSLGSECRSRDNCETPARRSGEVRRCRDCAPSPRPRMHRDAPRRLGTIASSGALCADSREPHPVRTATAQAPHRDIAPTRDSPRGARLCHNVPPAHYPRHPRHNATSSCAGAASTPD